MGFYPFSSTTTLFGTPADITVSELAIEAFLPADPETAEVMRRIAQSYNGRQDARQVSPERTRLAS